MRSFVLFLLRLLNFAKQPTPTVLKPEPKPVPVPEPQEHPVVLEARKYIGKREKPGNSGFFDGAFEADMVDEGWQKGWAWCSIFARLVFRKVYPEKEELKKLFNPSAVKTFQNFKDAGYPISIKPAVGSLVIWQQQKNGKPHWTGHAGIVEKVFDDEAFQAIEGNSNVAGSRDGDRVIPRSRRVVDDVPNGLKVLGFVII